MFALLSSEIFPLILPDFNQPFGGTCWLHLQGQRVRKEDMKQAQSSASCLAYFLILKMEAVCLSETSVNFYRLHSVTLQILMLIVPCYNILREKTQNKAWYICVWLYFYQQTTNSLIWSQVTSATAGLLDHR
jgi:uncharacterized membrane protein